MDTRDGDEAGIATALNNKGARSALASALKRHSVLSGLAAVVSIAAVAWVQPETAGGTALVIAVIFILFNLLGAIHLVRPGRKTVAETRKKVGTTHQVIAWLMLGAILVFIACSAPQRTSSESAPSVASLQAVPQSHSTRALRPVRAFVPAGDIPPPGVGAYGMVAFASLPTSSSRDRLKKVCLAYLAALPSQDSIPKNILLKDQMITFWPIRGEVPHNPDCDWLIDNYDLFGGTSAIQDTEAQGQKMRGRGPFLIGWSPSGSRGVKDAVVLILDMSPFDSQTSFDGQFEFWRHKITDNPSLWRSGFSVEGIRLAVHDFADRYGSDILKSISAWAK